MILQSLSLVWAAAAPAVANHLWQSTLFAALVALLTWFLQNNHARVRYWLWLAASVKFLVPFSLLIELGSLFSLSSAQPVKRDVVYFAMVPVSHAFVQHAMPHVASPPPMTIDSSPIHLLPEFIVAIWVCGFVAVLFTWFVRWRCISGVRRQSTPLLDGREVHILRRLEQAAGVRKPIDVSISHAPLEPGIFGIARPVLVLPGGVCAHLDDAQLETILAHEVCHVRRRDNLAAVTHMVVEALFWFHPMVWWLGCRLLAERERACDEQVLEWGSKRHVYAESILRVCEFCVVSSHGCASGITGASLKKRISRIMTGHAPRKLDFWTGGVLGISGLVIIALPITFGMANPPQSKLSRQKEIVTVATPRFETVSVKRYKSDLAGHRYGFSMMDPPYKGEFYAADVTLQDLIRHAYGVRSIQVLGGPAWVTSEKFDLQAKSRTSANNELRKLTPSQGELVKRRMLRALLADHFGLRLHRETKTLPVYALTIAKNGPELQNADPRTKGSLGSVPRHLHGLDLEFTPQGYRELTGHAVSMSLLARALMDFHALPEAEVNYHVSAFKRLLIALHLLHNPPRIWSGEVLDHTGLKGKYDFRLRWTAGHPGAASAGEPEGNLPVTPSTRPSERSAPPLFTAIQQQLGLKLQPEEGPVSVLVIEKVEQPSSL